MRNRILRLSENRQLRLKQQQTEYLKQALSDSEAKSEQNAHELRQEKQKNNSLLHAHKKERQLAQQAVQQQTRLEDELADVSDKYQQTIMENQQLLDQQKHLTAMLQKHLRTQSLIESQQQGILPGFSKLFAGNVSVNSTSNVDCIDSHDSLTRSLLSHRGSSI